MSHIDSALKVRGADRKLSKTFKASKPVPGTYDDIILSDAFLSGKLNPERTRQDVEGYLTDGAFVEYYFEIPDSTEEKDDGFGDLFYASYMSSIYEDMLHPFDSMMLSEGEDGITQGSPFTSIALAGALRPGVSHSRSRHVPMIRVRKCLRKGTVSYTVV